jgi:hypothetical protein
VKKKKKKKKWKKKQSIEVALFEKTKDIPEYKGTTGQALIPDHAICFCIHFILIVFFVLFCMCMTDHWNL